MPYPYPKDFVAEVTAAYPGNLEIAQALAAETSDRLGFWLDQYGFWPMRPSEFVRRYEAGEVEQVYEEAKKKAIALDLYGKWSEIAYPNRG